MRTFLVIVCMLWASASVQAEPVPVLRLATTTSTANSGLLDYLLPEFERSCSCLVHVIAVGSGKALKLGQDGNVDVLLVHARASEDKFMAMGYGIDRRDVMYNDFVLIGPPADPARIRGEQDVVRAMQKIARQQARFVSRGDNSGTEQMEMAYWQLAGIVPSTINQSRWYISAGQGMGEVLMMAGELAAYSLSDRATYVSYRDRTGLPILVQGDPRMFNPYGVIAVNPRRHAGVNYLGATAFIRWLTSPAGQQRIAAFEVNGERLFKPSAR